jgi:lysophospholipase L1-like esterase
MSRILIISACIIVFSIIIAGCARLAVKKQADTVPADDPAILYSGRIDFKDPKAPRFDWPGIIIQANFEGGWIGVIIKDGNDDYNVFIDGKPEAVIVTRPGVEEYRAAENLSSGAHLLTISRRGEGYQGVAVFKGLLLDRSGKLLTPPVRPKRKIEFIGDSLTVGFGVEGIGTSCPSEREFKNNWKAYSSITARAFNAEYHVAAISGRGLVKNWGEKEKTSKEPLPFYYDRTLQNDKDVKWDFKSWIPDMAVINLGTNDFSAPPVPDREVFIKAYLDLIKKVRANYPDAWILCCSGPAQQPPFNSYFAEIMEKAADPRVKRVDFGGLSEEELGCDWHPNEKGAIRIAGEFISQIKSITGWQNN